MTTTGGVDHRGRYDVVGDGAVHVTVATTAVAGTVALVDGDRQRRGLGGGVTEHFTRIVPPPPLPESSHWVMVALVVTPIGSQERGRLGAAALSRPVALVDGGRCGSAAPVMLLTMYTLHSTVPPPPLPDPLHWSTDVTSWSDVVSVVVHGSAAFAAP